LLLKASTGSFLDADFAGIIILDTTRKIETNAINLPLIIT